MTNASYTVVGIGVTPPPDISEIVETLESRYGAGQVTAMRVEFTPPIVTIPVPVPLPIGKGALGIDVSRWQGEVNWDAMAAAGVRFAGIRATMGETGVDVQFARNWREAKRVGVARMAYHYFVNGQSGFRQLVNFLKSLNGDIGEMPPVCDVEPTAGQVIADKTANTKEILDWLTECKEVTTQNPMIYTNLWAWNSCTDRPAWASNYKLWLAQYTTALAPVISPPWKECQIWQYSNAGNIGGTSPLDLNRYGPFP